MSIQKKSLISSLQSAKKANVVKEELGAATVSPAVKSPVRKMNAVRKAVAKQNLVRKAGMKSSLVRKASAKQNLVRKAVAKHANLSRKA